MMALKVDSRHRTLWATAVALKGFKSIPKASWGTSLVLLYDLDTGKLLHRVPFYERIRNSGLLHQYMRELVHKDAKPTP